MRGCCWQANQYQVLAQQVVHKVKHCYSLTTTAKTPKTVGQKEVYKFSQLIVIHGQEQLQLLTLIFRQLGALWRGSFRYVLHTTH